MQYFLESVQRHQIPVYRPRSLTLLDYHYPHLMSEPLPELIQVGFHAPDTVVVYPTSYYLIESCESDCKGYGCGWDL